MTGQMKTHIVLLRGVMPTGKNRVPMADLRTSLTEAGFQDVKTYIQSGNVILKSDLDREAIESLIHKVIFKKIGADITIIARARNAFNDIFMRNPYPLEAKSRTYFILLESEPDKELLNSLQALDFSPDHVMIHNDSIYILFAEKYSSSKYNTNFFERKLKVAATARNFNTMSRLLELTA